MAQGPSDTISVAIQITLRIRESKVRNPDPPDRRRFVLSECISCSVIVDFLNALHTLRYRDTNNLRFVGQRRLQTKQLCAWHHNNNNLITTAQRTQLFCRWRHTALVTGCIPVARRL